MYARETNGLILEKIIKENQRVKQKVEEFVERVNDYFEYKKIDKIELEKNK